MFSSLLWAAEEKENEPIKRKKAYGRLQANRERRRRGIGTNGGEEERKRGITHSKKEEKEGENEKKNVLLLLLCYVVNSSGCLSVWSAKGRKS